MADLALLPALANRHGCITGATGTGKTITLQVLAEGFSRIGPITPEERQGLMAGSLVAGVYEQALDRESAFEKLQARAAAPTQPAMPPAPKSTAAAEKAPKPRPQKAPAPEPEPARSELEELLFGRVGPRGGQHEGLVDVLAKNAARSVGSGIGRQVVRGVLGSLLSGRR